MQLAYIFGRTPRLALKELEVTATILPFRWSLISVQAEIARLKPEIELVDGTGYLSLKDQKNQVALLNLQKRLGGTTRTVYLHKQCGRAELVPEFLRMIKSAYPQTEGKLTLGLSVWGKGLQPFHLAKPIKKQFQEEGQSVRFVTPTQGTTLSTAQVVHNRLAYFPEQAKRMELVAIQENSEWWIGSTLTVQDIENYSKRDFSIPEPDAVSGMVSPKLAQTMINLAVEGDASASVYDPFCGNGRIVLEGWYMGIPTYGSDIVAKKVSSTEANLSWLAKEYELPIPNPGTLVWEMDATSPEAPRVAAGKIKSPWHIVGEPFLGRPLRAALTKQEAPVWLAELKPLYENFFKTWSSALHKPASMLLVMPRARVAEGWDASLYDQIVDRLKEFGYSSEVLFCYSRPDSFVRRDLVRVSYTK